MKKIVTAGALAVLAAGWVFRKPAGKMLARAGRATTVLVVDPERRP
ncbi:hypothetical protein [Amycolatopsis sp. GM8]|nr:hypothetical protein [Amycolatopsis sp. GM8]